MVKIQEKINQAVRHLQIADHMIYATYPIIDNKKFLLKIIEKISSSITNSIDAIIEFEHATNNKKPTQSSSSKNEEPAILVLEKYSKDYNLNKNDIKKIKEILEINKQHKESAMEFVKNNKLVILSNSLGIKIIDIKLVKSYLLVAKELLLKVNQKVTKKS